MAKKKSKSKKKKEKKTIIHIKLEYHEAKSAKEDILSSELCLLRILKNLNNYKETRNQELNKKIEIAKKIKELKTNITKIKTTLPKYKLPELLKKENKEYVREIEDEDEPDNKRTVLTNSIDEELDEIQRKLKILQRT